jgi:phenylalanyl-tRNA synthetase beta chain
VDNSLTSVQHVVDQPRCAVRVTVRAGAVVGKVIEVRDHPNADRLWIAQVDIGDRKLTIVHGGTRSLRPGDLVPAAPPGAVVKVNDRRKRMRTRRYRGQRSEGMLCSTNELGWTTNGPDAVHVLVEGAPGQPLVSAVLASRGRSCG